MSILSSSRGSVKKLPQRYSVAAHPARSGLFALVLFLLVSPIAGTDTERTDASSEGFPERVNGAYAAALRGEFGKAFRAFEELLQSNPGEFVVYDFYGQVLELKGNFRKAEEVYLRWVRRNQGRKTPEIELLSLRIQDLQKKKEFLEKMKHVGPWKLAKVLKENGFSVKTNIPNRNRDEVIRHLKEIIEKETRLLTGLFDAPMGEVQPMNVFIGGTGEDYEWILRELKRDKIILPYPKAFYAPELRTIALYFDGTADLYSLAHETTHYLVRRYIPEPSPLLDEGLADYMGIRLYKNQAKASLLNWLDHLNWLYENGEWEYPFPRDSDRFKGREGYYLRAWALVSFLIEEGESRLGQLFRKYLNFERGRPVNNDEGFLNFFKENLSETEFKDFVRSWQNFTLNVSYDTI